MEDKNEAHISTLKINPIFAQGSIFVSHQKYTFPNVFKNVCCQKNYFFETVALVGGKEKRRDALNGD